LKNGCLVDAARPLPRNGGEEKLNGDRTNGPHRKGLELTLKKCHNSDWLVILTLI